MRKTQCLRSIGALWCVLAFFNGSTPLFAKPESERREVQRHGYVFEKWVRDTFFEGYEAPSYTQEWDVAASANKRYGGLPISIKTAKYGSSVDLGDALRQYSINENFMIIIGYWKQEGAKKRFVNIVAVRVDEQKYHELWQPIAWADLQRLDALVKNRALTSQQARDAARTMKRLVPFSKAVMDVNPKIDDKAQRRLQCSMSFKEVFQYLAPTSDASVQVSPKLFGVAAPEPFLSMPRQYTKKEK
jgi:hypothetical protein